MTAMIVADLLPIVVGVYRDFGALARRDAIPNLHRMSPLVEIRAGVQYHKSLLLVRCPMKIATNIGYFFSIILGVTLLLVSLWLVLPVLVNFPASWPGAGRQPRQAASPPRPTEPSLRARPEILAPTVVFETMSPRCSPGAVIRAGTPSQLDPGT